MHAPGRESHGGKRISNKHATSPNAHTCLVQVQFRMQIQRWFLNFFDSKPVHVRTVGFIVLFRDCRAIQGGALLSATLCSYLVSDTWPLRSPSRLTIPQ